MFLMIKFGTEFNFGTDEDKFNSAMLVHEIINGFVYGSVFLNILAIPNFKALFCLYSYLSNCRATINLVN